MLEEVRNLLTLEDEPSCIETRFLAKKKLTLIEDRLANLTRMRNLLMALISEVESGKRPRSCPIISTLTKQ